MIASTASTLFEHQQPQFVLLTENPFANNGHLFCRQMVDVHAHRGTHPFAPFQCAVIIRQTRIVHLYQTRFQGLVTLTDSGHVLFLEPTVPQFQILLSVVDGAHHFHPVLHINHMCTHSF